MIAALLLAAGASRRFGSQKLVALLDGKPLVRWAAESLDVTGVDERIVIVGRDGDRVRLALDGLPLRFVENPMFESGIASSLRAGLLALDVRCRAVIVALGDLPRIPDYAIARLIAEWKTNGAMIVVPSYRGERGHPVLFDTRMLPELLAIEGDVGARAAIARDASRVRVVEMDTALPRDVDEREDLEGLSVQ